MPIGINNRKQLRNVCALVFAYHETTIYYLSIIIIKSLPHKIPSHFRPSMVKRRQKPDGPYKSPELDDAASDPGVRAKQKELNRQ